MELPGVGEVTAGKIIANRPYKSTDDLSRAGLSDNAINKIAAMVTVKSGRTRAANEATSADRPATHNNNGDVAASEKLDLNTASEAQLLELPGVGAVYAKKIMEGRPYKAISDLSEAGLPPSTIAKISGMVTVSHAHRRTSTESSRTPQSTTADRPVQRGDSTRTRASNRADAPANDGSSRTNSTQADSSATAGKVWLNTNTHIYHKSDSRWYGKTHEGKFVSEEEAIREGARAAENE